MKKFLLIVISILMFSSMVYAKAYTRIISLAPSITKSLYELGIDKELLGITSFCPKGKSQKEIIGTLIEPDLEKIISLKPDLIIAAKEGNSKVMVEKLQRAGFDIYTMEMSQGFEELCKNFEALGKVLGKEKEAGNIIKKAQSQIDEIYKAAQNRQIQTVFWEIGDKPLYTAGGKSFLNGYNKYSNTKNIYDGVLNARYSPIDIEDVLMRNPDIIIAADMDGNDAAQIRSSWAKYSSIKAVKNKKIYVFSADDLFGLTPTIFAETLKKIFNTIQ
ncbi:MAG: helical backbone metal receptor [Endomicrobium sp.]|jgi:iron complex transport system substrate-binding protein|nr:helical backbone metal receptor [Endomicrobium sp.]